MSQPGQQENQLRQSQQMKAIGRLIGDVAHDFNNLFAAILANTQFLIEDLGEQDPRRLDAQQIKVAAERATSLNRQLMAVSQNQVLASRSDWSDWSDYPEELVER